MKEANFANITWLALKLSLTLHFCKNFCPSFILVTLNDCKALKAYAQNISKGCTKYLKSIEAETVEVKGEENLGLVFLLLQYLFFS